jgi:hypothetical protein
MMVKLPNESCHSEAESSADFVLFEVCGFSRSQSLKAADLQKTQVCALSASLRRPLPFRMFAGWR